MSEPSVPTASEPSWTAPESAEPVAAEAVARPRGEWHPFRASSLVCGLLALLAGGGYLLARVLGWSWTVEEDLDLAALGAVALLVVSVVGILSALARHLRHRDDPAD